MRSDLQFWNAAAMALFLLFGGAAYYLVDSVGEFKSLKFLDILVLALATFRLSHLFTNDKIFDFVRTWVFDRKGRKPAASEEGLRRILCEVIECLWCAGLWAALIVVTVYQLGRAGVFAVLLLAVAGAAALLSIGSKALLEK